MKDLLGKEIEVGQIVAVCSRAFGGGLTATQYYVVGFSPAMVRVADHTDKKGRYVKPSYIIVMEES